MMVRRARSIHLLAGASVVALCSAASIHTSRASEPCDKKQDARAQERFDEAKRLLQAGRVGEACSALAECQKMCPTLGTRFFLADCLERAGKLLEALNQYLAVADEAKATGQKEKAEYARSRAEALRARMPRIEVLISGPLRTLDHVEVKLDESTLAESSWGAALPVDLGEHTVTATASGKKPWRRQVSVRQLGEVVEVSVPPLDDVQSVAIPKLERQGEPRPPASVPTWVWISGGVGVALIGAGVGSRVDEAFVDAELRESCTIQMDGVPRCPRSYDYMSANARKRRDNTLIVGFEAAGLVGAGAAVLGALLHAPKKSGSTGEKNLTMIPLVSPNAQGLALRGGF